MAKPKRCPFCGGEVYIAEEWADAVSSFFTFCCDACGMYCTQNYHVSKAEAIEAWNRRIDDD